MNQDFAYLSSGKLYVKRGDNAPEALESKFGESIRQRANEIHRRHAWKIEGRGAKFMGGSALWGGAPDQGPPEVPITLTGLSRGCRPGQLLYTMTTPDVSGIFLLREGDFFERRLFHSADHRVAEVCADPDCDRIAFALRHRDGTSSLAMMNSEGSDFTEITQGDSADEYPRWVPGHPGILVFQSAGIGRDAKGAFAARGPYSVQQLDLETGEMKCLVENERFDFLAPQISRDGALYYIRRPHETRKAQISPWRLLLDVLLFPFRLLYALFHYLNFFSVLYTGKPLKTAGNARAKELDMRRLMLMGNYSTALQAMKQAANPETPAVVPSSWELIRSNPNGVAPEVLAKGVLSFDLQEDGSMVYSNGSSVFRLDAMGKSVLAHKGTIVEHVVALNLLSPVTIEERS